MQQTPDTPTLEHRLGRRARAVLPAAAREFALFVLKQCWAALFGGLMLAALILTRILWHPDWPVARYDALFLIALAIQAAFLRFRLETWAEARVILAFHLTGTAMEWFKVQAGSWSYPDPGVIVVLGVPLFSGFMYASVGSYIARVIRIFDMRFAPFPPLWAVWLLSAAIYANFFTHHLIADLRWPLILMTVALFARTRISFRVAERDRQMPLPVAAFLSALALWLAENIGTLTGTWVYGGHATAHWAGPAKLGAWYLLLYVAFGTVTAVIRPEPARPRHATATLR